MCWKIISLPIVLLPNTTSLLKSLIVPIMRSTSLAPLIGIFAFLLNSTLPMLLSFNQLPVLFFKYTLTELKFR